MGSVLLRPGGLIADEAGQTGPAGWASTRRSSEQQRASEPEASGAGGGLLQAPMADLESGRPGTRSVLLRPGRLTAAEAGQTPAGWAAMGRSRERQPASEPEASGAGADLLQAPVADLKSGRAAGGPPYEPESLPHEPESLPHKPEARRSARVAARLARQASRGCEISMPTGGDAPAPKRVCTEARRSAGCAHAGAAKQIAGFEGAHTDGEDLRRPGEQEPASSMAGAAAAAGLPAGTDQEFGVSAGLVAPAAAAAAASVARPAATVGFNLAAGFAALHSQGAAQGRPGSLGSPAECAECAEGWGGAPCSRQALTQESAWDRMRTWLLAARKAVRLPADPGVAEWASANSL